jgi:hypothetical protein
VWAHAFDEWLCAECRHTRTYKLLAESVTAIPVDDLDDEDGASPFDTSFLRPDVCELCDRPVPWHKLMCPVAAYGFVAHEFMGLPSVMRELL